MLRPAKRLEIQVLVANVTDSLSSTPSFVTREWGRLGQFGMRVRRYVAPITDCRW